MNTQDDGGSAFPEVRTDTVGSRGDYRQETYSVGGMTLRDYFAAKAMHAMYVAALPTGKQTAYTEVAKVAYFAADAMLAERAKQ
jgi:hypothetical protein